MAGGRWQVVGGWCIRSKATALNLVSLFGPQLQHLVSISDHRVERELGDLIGKFLGQIQLCSILKRRF